MATINSQEMAKLAAGGQNIDSIFCHGIRRTVRATFQTTTNTINGAAAAAGDALACFTVPAGAVILGFRAFFTGVLGTVQYSLGYAAAPAIYRAAAIPTAGNAQIAIPATSFEMTTAANLLNGLLVKLPATITVLATLSVAGPTGVGTFVIECEYVTD